MLHYSTVGQKHTLTLGMGSGTMLDMQESTWSNLTYSQPLTAANIQRAVNKMQQLSDGQISIRPDILIIPPGLVERTIYAGRLAVERLVRLLAQPSKRGRFEQRQRRKAQGVWAQRMQRRQRLERQLVETLEFLAMFEHECGQENPRDFFDVAGVQHA